MRYDEQPPPAVLAAHVAALWTLSSDGAMAPDGAGTIVPDGGIEIVVSLADPLAWGERTACELNHFVVGPMARPTRVHYAGAVELAAARIRPSAGAAFLGQPPHNLAGSVWRLASVLPALAERLADALRGLRHAAAAAPVLADVLAGHLRTVPPPDPLVDAAAGRLAEPASVAGITALARQLDVSVRTLERRFRAASGLSPKRFARIVRFAAAWQAAANGNDTWIEIATDRGLFDQSHLIREFRELAGFSPGEAIGGPLPARRRRRPLSRPSKHRPGTSH